jgi:catalase
VTPSAEQAVDAMEKRSGRYPAARRAHAKGTLCRGVFRPTPDAAALTTAEHFHRSEVPVTVRFSNAHADPGRDDRKDVRGMATRFYLDQDHRRYTDLLAATLPCFFVRTADDFVSLNRRGLKGWLFVLLHRETWRATRAAFRPKRVPSYANCRFNALHTYRWIDADGAARYVRYSWVPVEGELAINKRQANSLPHDYLQQDLTERLTAEPVRPVSFRLELQIASDGVNLFDPTVVWPRRNGRFVDAGLLEVTAVDHDMTAAQLGGFDPTRVTEGIEAPAEDEILQFRPGCYDVSFERRTA